jgi:hypothetical protein
LSIQQWIGIQGCQMVYFRTKIFYFEGLGMEDLFKAVGCIYIMTFWYILYCVASLILIPLFSLLYIPRNIWQPWVVCDLANSARNSYKWIVLRLLEILKIVLTFLKRSNILQQDKICKHYMCTYIE